MIVTYHLLVCLINCYGGKAQGIQVLDYIASCTLQAFHVSFVKSSGFNGIISVSQAVVSNKAYVFILSINVL